jgi:ribose transport system ATP-binding protein
MTVANLQPTLPAPILEFEGISKSFFGIPVLRAITLRVAEGRLLGLIGENGAGKSTLMNLLGGVFPPDAGRMRVAGSDHAPRDPLEASRRGVAFIHQELNLFTNLTVEENISIAAFPCRRLAGIPFIDRRALRARAEALLAEVNLRARPDTPVAALSQGERQLVEIAKALGADARIIIFDEPTTSLTARETERLFAMIGRLRARGMSMVYISHILGDVKRLCDDIAVLRDGELVGGGPAGELDVDTMVSLMVGRRIEQLYPPRGAAPGDTPLLEARGLSEPGIIDGITFTLREGEVLGVFGLMGSGRTELARILFGLDRRAAGDVIAAGEPLLEAGPRGRIRRGLAFVTENRREEGLLLESSLEENIALVALPSFARSRARLVDRRALARAVGAASDRAGIRGTALDRQAARTLSGGNQQKVVLAKWLIENPRVLILDEPTRGIDVGAKHEIYKLINGLAAAGAGILFISSEIEELTGMCDRILVLARGESRGVFERRDFDRERILKAALG